MKDTKKCHWCGFDSGGSQISMTFNQILLKLCSIMLDFSKKSQLPLIFNVLMNFIFENNFFFFFCFQFVLKYLIQTMMESLEKMSLKLCWRPWWWYARKIALLRNWWANLVHIEDWDLPFSFTSFDAESLFFFMFYLSFLCNRFKFISAMLLGRWCIPSTWSRGCCHGDFAVSWQWSGEEFL